MPNRLQVVIWINNDIYAALSRVELRVRRVFQICPISKFYTVNLNTDSNIPIWNQAKSACFIEVPSVTIIECLLTQWRRVTPIFVSKLAIICSNNGLSSDRRQAIIWTNAGILFIWPLGTKISDMLIEINPFHSRKRTWMSAKCGPFCPGLNVLRATGEG